MRFDMFYCRESFLVHYLLFWIGGKGGDGAGSSTPHTQYNLNGAAEVLQNSRGPSTKRTYLSMQLYRCGI